jgi:hypothetical protein
MVAVHCPFACVQYSEYSGGRPVPCDGNSLARSRHAIAKMPQQRQPCSLSPRLRHYGGCSRVSRRLLWRKIRDTAARPVLAAAQFGDNFVFCALYRL